MGTLSIYANYLLLTEMLGCLLGCPWGRVRRWVLIISCVFRVLVVINVLKCKNRNWDQKEILTQTWSRWRGHSQFCLQMCLSIPLFCPCSVFPTQSPFISILCVCVCACAFLILKGKAILYSQVGGVCLIEFPKFGTVMGPVTAWFSLWPHVMSSLFPKPAP